MKKRQKSLSFVMAGYNEEKIAVKAIKTVEEVLEEYIDDYEIILVNDGSSDHTLELMQKCARQNPRIKVLNNLVNLNYGSAVLRGLKAATKDYVVYDAFDLEMHPLDFVKRFLALKDTVDVVIYERKTYEAVKWRRFASRLNRMALNICFPKLMRGTPVLNHTQLFKRKYLEQIIPLSRSPIFFSAEMIFRAKLKGLVWKNEKIPFNSIDGVRPGAFGHVYDILWALQDMFRFRLLLWDARVKRSSFMICLHHHE